MDIGAHIHHNMDVDTYKVQVSKMQTYNMAYLVPVKVEGPSDFCKK